MTVERTDPPGQADERTSLASFLDYHRATLAWKCAGLTAAQLRERPVPPSTMSLLGLVRHLADVERGWFQRTFAGEEAPRIYYSDDDPDGDFDNVDEADADEAFATWRAECERSRQILAAAPSLDATATTRHGEIVSLRWIMLHMIEEYARHNGHADLFRERLDGATGE
ncbi:MAG TPA: DinB family protein [Actinophytocola sp.]|uniref:DinB family protein n=1 Tax=Actinophytocola sp. TaxID=1872138 RepID=UPI002DDD9144|nr:DinB family protein [Actinophytocola sp.]HEV2782137.1 DinB family protein [Actinophytocola sp.]